MNQSPFKNRKRRLGFALVIALSLMAFVLLLILSMSTVIQVETKNSLTHHEQLRARETARLALMIAIGELQKHAGPDQRVTARAEILGDNIQNGTRFWTGVWNSAEPESQPAWLVSGENPNPEKMPLPSLPMLGAASVGDEAAKYVLAPLVRIPSESANTSEYAWWIADEGVKASVNLHDKSETLDDCFFDQLTKQLPLDEQRQLLRQQCPRNYNLRGLYGKSLEFVPGEIEDITNFGVKSRIDAANASMGKILNSKQLELLSDFTSARLKSAFHDSTLLSQAVLTNTEQGGLKFDLSALQTNDSGGLKVTQDVLDFLWNTSPDTNGNLPLKGISSGSFENYDDNSAINTLPVIITEFSLYFVVSGERKASSTARAFLQLEVEVWSPYGFRHDFNGNSGSDTPELTVEFENLPETTLKFYDKDTNAYTSSTTLQFEEISPTFELDFTDTHKSGELRRLTGSWPINASANKSSFYYTRNWSWTIDDPAYNSKHRSVSFPTGDSINYTSAPAKFHLLIRNKDGELLQRIDNIPIGAIATDFAYYQDRPSWLSPSEAPLIFQYRMRDSREDLEAWFTEIDPRSLVLDLNDTDILEHIDVNDVDGDYQGDPDLPSLNAFSKVDFLHGKGNNSFYRLYDVPATTPISVGVLQHLQFKGMPPHSVGNKWGKTLNDIFDRHFISGIPRASGSNTTPFDELLIEGSQQLPNPFITFVARDTPPSSDQLRSAGSAQHLLQNGAFNINSTSSEAWNAVLASNYIYNWSYTENKGTNTEKKANRLNLEAAFFRLPFSGHTRSKAFTNWPFPFELYEEEHKADDDYPDLTDDEKGEIFKRANPFNPGTDWRPSSSIGHRELSTTEIQTLAENIVKKLREKQRPFVSIKEFVNSGIIQDCIDATSINTIIDGADYLTAVESERLPRNATSFLSQADIFSALSPAFTARSDTFKIRAAGTAATQTPQTQTTTYCEATIQRLPQLLTPNPSNSTENATGFGRQFRILDIQWLDSSQL